METTTEPARRPALPASVFAAALVGCLFLGLLALEISHGLIQKNGTIARSLFVFPLVLVLVWGLLARRRWAYWVSRGVAALAALGFTGVGVYACIDQPRDQHGPVWVWIACVSFILAAFLWVGFFCLGTSSTRRYFARPSDTGALP